MKSRKIVFSGLVVAVGILTVAAFGAPQRSVTIEGYVLDSSCAFVQNLSKPLGKGCALECAKNGSALVIITDDGTIYWPVSDATPAVGQNPRLMEFAGRRVEAKGKLYLRGGSHAIVLDKVAPVAAKQ